MSKSFRWPLIAAVIAGLSLPSMASASPTQSSRCLSGFHHVSSSARRRECVKDVGLRVASTPGLHHPSAPVSAPSKRSISIHSSSNRNAKLANSTIDTITVGGSAVASETEKLYFCADMAFYLNQEHGDVPYYNYAIATDTCYFYVTGAGWYQFSESNLPMFATLEFPIAVPYK